MIAARKRVPLSPEAMQALAALPQIGLGSAPQTIPGAEAPMEMSRSLVEMPQAAPGAPVSLAAGDMSGLVPAAAQTKIGGGGILSKIGEALKAPGVSAALLRSAGATLNGGLGAGIAAGTSFMDKRRIEDETIRQNALEFGLKTRLAANTERATAQTGRFQEGTLANGRDRNNVSLYGINTGAQTARRGQDIGASTTMRGQDIGASTAIRGQDVSRLNNVDSVGASYYATDTGAQNNQRTVNATMFGRPPTTATTVTTKAVPAQNNWFSENVPAQPATSTTTTSAAFPRVPPRAQLQAGQIYQTANGPARWDGKQFVQ